MATVLNRNTREILYSVNTPDYPESEWIINPDISVVENVPKKYWEISGNVVKEMSVSEKIKIDEKELPKIKKDKKNQIDIEVNRFVLNRGYTTDIQRSLMFMYSDSVGLKPNLAAYLQEWVSWIKRIDFEREVKKNLINNQITAEDVNSIFIDYEALATFDPRVSIYSALNVSDSTKLDAFYKNIITDEPTGVSGPDYLINLFRLRRDVYNDSTNPVYIKDYTPLLGSEGFIQDHSSRILILEERSMGKQGETGLQGVGIQGETGIQGINGDTGIQGIGLQGTTGLGGIQGNTGVQGTGQQGLTGLQGTTGLRGIQGNTGAQGAGSTGLQGVKGDTGIQGIGLQGETGLQGVIGNTGIQGITGIQIDANRLTTNVEESNAQRVYVSNLAPGTAGFLLVSGTAYFVYLGRVTQAITPKYIEFHVSTAGTGTQTAEVGFFSSSSPPSKSGQSVSKIVSTGTVDSLTGTGVKRNTSAFSTSVSAGTHLWAGIRTAMVTTQPTIWGFGADMGQGHILRTTSAGVLTGTGPWTGAVVTASTSASSPDLRGTLD